MGRARIIVISAIIGTTLGVIFQGCGEQSRRAASAVKLEKDYPIEPVALTEVKFTDEFWGPRIETNRRVTIPHIFKQCENRIAAKEALPRTKIQEKDTKTVLEYIGLESEKDSLNKEILIKMIDAYEAQGTITPKQLKELNTANARLSYKKAA